MIIEGIGGYFTIISNDILTPDHLNFCTLLDILTLDLIPADTFNSYTTDSGIRFFNWKHETELP